MDELLLQWESPVLDYYWCHHLLHDVYVSGEVRAILGDQERQWLASCDEDGFGFWIPQGEVSRMAAAAREFYADAARLSAYFALIEDLSSELEKLPWEPDGETSLAGLHTLETLFHRAISLHLCSQPHLTAVVDAALMQGLDELELLPEARQEVLDWLLRPRRLPQVLRERLEWHDNVLAAAAGDQRDRLLAHHATWTYLTAGDSKQPTSVSDLQHRLHVDQEDLETVGMQADRLRAAASGILNPMPSVLAGQDELCARAAVVRDLSYYRFMTRQCWMKVWYLMEQARARLGMVEDGLVAEEVFEGRPTRGDRSSYVLECTDGFMELFYNGTDVARRGERLSMETMLGSRVLTGATGFPGRVRGVVLNISWTDSLEAKRDLIGDDTILVTPQTTPDFVPLLNRCAGLVTDEGGLTGHASIIAREMRLPALIGTRFGTKLLRDGDVVELDASAGRIDIVHR
ncbi:PEP-utilizing enzyme [Nocardioides piscis]|uniref:PEP-utilising enzyme mobile domain-containing protein n=1 Tax=Nocardioides piscis TaxID=2714938 RepID=A0A6G7YJ66_9ACTN|nr:PEP-utilizing enzyme [Nocardioides piscis]QIK76791.1 hypothetical protein G7071_16520 [Nocardioides piscis]